MDIQPVEFIPKTHITLLDWGIIILSILLTLGIGLYYTKRSQKSVKDYFASGQGMPWWILGTSMVATTFAADTPLAIAGLLVTQGIWGNWFYWAQVPQFMLGVYFFSRLWRRARVLTDNELIDIRYTGKSANLLRGFRAVYFAIPYNAITLGFVILPMTNILGMTFNIPKYTAVIISILITVAYTVTSGLSGVMMTSFFQFILAMGMAIVLAIVGVNAAGGFGPMLEKMTGLYGATKATSMLSLIPAVDAPNYGFLIFILYITMMWWTTGPTDGGAYFAQRMIAAKNEKHAFLGYFWFNLWHCALRPWPWIIVGMAAAVLFPGIAARNTLTGGLDPNPELGYVAVMLDYLKPGLLGLMLAGFLAAFMSTISAQINWGASYLINDLYRPYIKKGATEKHYVRASMVMVLFSAVLGGIISFFMKSIMTGWLLLWAINAGIGVVYIARWYWWRVNAWSEITAIGSLIGTIALILFIPSDTAMRAILIGIESAAFIALIFFGFTNKAWRQKHLKSFILIATLFVMAISLVLFIRLPLKTFPMTLIYTLPISLSLWLTVTMLTKATDENVLIEFYRRVHPGGPGWKRIADKISEDLSSGHLFNRKNLTGFFFGILGTYATLLGLGCFVTGRNLFGALWMVVLAISTYFVLKTLSSESWEQAHNIE